MKASELNAIEAKGRSRMAAEVMSLVARHIADRDLRRRWMDLEQQVKSLANEIEDHIDAQFMSEDDT